MAATCATSMCGVHGKTSGTSVRAGHQELCEEVRCASLFLIAVNFIRCTCDSSVLTQQDGETRITAEGQKNANSLEINKQERKSLPSSSQKKKAKPSDTLNNQTKNLDHTFNSATDHPIWRRKRMKFQMLQFAPANFSQTRKA